MTSRERFFRALAFQPTDRPPHFELTFELTQEAFGLEFPSEAEMRSAAPAERQRLFERCADLYARIIETYRWDAVCVWNPAGDYELLYDFVPFLKRRLGPDIPVGSFLWWAVLCIDSIRDYVQFSVDLYENRDEVRAQAAGLAAIAMEHARKLIEVGCDFIVVGSDMAYNAGPFMDPKFFPELVTPYLVRLIGLIRRNGVAAFFHSDGNLMPILDQILEAGPDVLHSIDPMAGMDIAEVKKRTYGRMALMGNVQCSLLQDGPDGAIENSAAYCLEHGAKGGGYIFSSSNTIFRGLPLKNYKVMLDFFHKQVRS